MISLMPTHVAAYRPYATRIPGSGGTARVSKPTAAPTAIMVITRVSRVRLG
jgi:hypothetical protein